MHSGKVLEFRNSSKKILGRHWVILVFERRRKERKKRSIRHGELTKMHHVAGMMPLETVVDQHFVNYVRDFLT